MLKSKIQVTASAFPLISTIQTCVFVSPKQNVCGRCLPVSTITKTRESAVNIFHIFFIVGLFSHQTGMPNLCIIQVYPAQFEVYAILHTCKFWLC